MLRWLLFETRLGDLMLALFERLTGLALVEVESLESQVVSANIEKLPASVRTH